MYIISSIQLSYRLHVAKTVAAEPKRYSNIFLCSQIFSYVPEDSTAPPVPPPRITPRKRQPITISKRPPRVYQALSPDHFQHTESNYQPPLA